MNLTENLVEASRPKNRFAKNPKITIVIPNTVYELISNNLSENSGVNVGIEDLKKNRAVLRFIENDIDSMYWDQFGEGLDNLDMAEELGYVQEYQKDEDNDDDDEPYRPEWAN